MIVITNPSPIKNETHIVHTLFEEGLALLHIRKPDFSENEMARFIQQIKPEYRSHLVLHSHHVLAEDFGITKIHFSERERKNNFSIDSDQKAFSTATHSIEDFNSLENDFDYAFLSPVFKSISKESKYKIVGLNVLSSILLTANWFSFIYVMNHVSVKATSLAYLVCPILTTLLAYFILREKLSKTQWISVGLSISGCMLLSYAAIMDMVFSIIIGLTYAAYLVSQRANKGFDKFIVLTFHITLAALFLVPFYPSYGGPVPTEFKFYFCIETIAVLFTIVPLFLNLYALSGINSSTVGMLLNINPMIAFGLAAFFLF